MNTILTVLSSVVAVIIFIMAMRGASFGQIVVVLIVWAVTSLPLYWKAWRQRNYF